MLSLLRVVANQPSSRIAAVDVLSLREGGGDLGLVQEILAPEGTVVKVGDVVAILSSNDTKHGPLANLLR